MPASEHLAPYTWRNYPSGNTNEWTFILQWSFHWITIHFSTPIWWHTGITYEIIEPCSLAGDRRWEFYSVRQVLSTHKRQLWQFDPPVSLSFYQQSDPVWFSRSMLTDRGSTYLVHSENSPEYKAGALTGPRVSLQWLFWEGTYYQTVLSLLSCDW